jgi:3-deoxy-manno-octulosonate cytidylyltransferase (CMP-KDO synthetase)
MERLLILMVDGQMHNAIGLIPTRLASRRLPRKSLKLLGGIPVIIHTYRRAKLAKKLKDVFICCDSKEVFDVAKKYNAKAIMTSKKHKCGTDRISEALKKIKKNYDQILNIQGDEPLIDPKNIDSVIQFHRKNKKYDIILPNLKTKFINNPNVVRLIFNKNNEVIYITRSSTPYQFIKKTKCIYKHLSIISFKPKKLNEYASKAQSGLELIEDIELLRAIDLGFKIKTFSLNGDSFSIDVYQNLVDARKKILKDKHYKIYAK